MNVRQSEAKRQAWITSKQWCADLSMFPGRKEKATGSFEIAIPLKTNPRLAPTGTRRFNAYVMPERRRIVAQVRREAPKNRGFFAAQDSPHDATIC
jgi:hypothetical protein